MGQGDLVLVIDCLNQDLQDSRICRIMAVNCRNLRLLSESRILADLSDSTDYEVFCVLGIFRNIVAYFDDVVCS